VKKNQTLKQGIALTECNTTGPPCSVTDDDRRQWQTTTNAGEQNNTGLLHYV